MSKLVNIAVKFCEIVTIAFKIMTVTREFSCVSLQAVEEGESRSAAIYSQNLLFCCCCTGSLENGCSQEKSL
jgi:hypothetical protein